MQVGTLSQNYPMVSFQEQQSQAAFERLANMIQQYLVTPCIEREKVKVAKVGHDHKSLSFQVSVIISWVSPQSILMNDVFTWW